MANITKELETQKIFVINEAQISEAHEEFIKNYFIQRLSPVLMTIILNDLTEFPTLNDTAAYLAVKMVLIPEEGVENKREKDTRYALIEIPKGIDRCVVLPKIDDRDYIIILDDLIRYSLRNIFTMFSYESITAHMIKITRDAELDIDSDLLTIKTR